MSTKASTESGNGRDGDDAPPHAPGQLPDTPPGRGSASGSGGVDGSKGDSSDKAGDAPQPDSDVPDEVPPHEDTPAQDHPPPGPPAGLGPPLTGVDSSAIHDPAAIAAAFASVGQQLVGQQLVGQQLVTQQVISADTAKCIFQGELDLETSDTAAAIEVDPTLPGDIPPARFGVRQDPSSFVVGIPATHADLLSGHFMRDGYGGLETLAFVETLSDEDIQDLT
ncbi:hypothetical protein PF005_g7870 [Phytophthora fragariae]|uniref:Uncharacterized protein n=1 Tax=Phytophthora fragariae TaxID=53985 RepID=A0A6A3SPC1_9STRA|nr:hypothetical protein PF003_g31911 [Phytophthora fragariae]KAE8928539.1 hypothetical protein PF009_g21321 [Phytophthora fragariae]KAE9023997.1 hypothetical protein PF011_g3698 [Phytophthora fragariae]KAE9077777.1 hypothetical protein PF007_g24116 [Phytophthora fragariae]KAE9087516.1 hypothetical protein PF010_g19698 [Phytophthora fragariae]